MQTLEEINVKIKELESKRDTITGRPTEVYSRIVGYYRSIHAWNPGKRKEFNERLSFTLPRE
jgi:ribonucleoside-triphosphate reductase